MAATANPAALGTKFLIGPTKAALKNSAYLSDEWAPDEVAVVEELLIKYTTESEMYRYAQIAMQLKDKCIRDVILRCRWMSQKLTDSMPKLTHVANRTIDPPYARAIMPMDSDGGISYQAIGGPAGQLLEQNARALDQISANFVAFKVQLVDYEKVDDSASSQQLSEIFRFLSRTSLNDVSEMVASTLCKAKRGARQLNPSATTILSR